MEPPERLPGLSDDVGAGFIAGHGSQSASGPEVDVERLVDLPPQEEISGMGMSKVIRADQKRFFFDLGSNNRGHYLRISEVAGVDRSSIILPLSGLKQFHEMVGHFVDIMKDRLEGMTGANVCHVVCGNVRSRTINSSGGDNNVSFLFIFFLSSVVRIDLFGTFCFFGGIISSVLFVGWGSPNIEMDEHTFLTNRERAVDYLNSLDKVFVNDQFLNWDPENRIKVRIISARAYHSLFMHNMCIRPTDEELESFGTPDFTIYNAGQFPCNRYTHYMTSSTSVDGRDTCLIGMHASSRMAGIDRTIL
ncbi:Transcription factor Pur-alpha 1 [Zea mays]|nr:Transcription factor Pur-alpha 1 [Zea mays]AQK89519.1 Transcription factor Pur-alpha 1 [Zea mays]